MENQDRENGREIQKKKKFRLKNFVQPIKHLTGTGNKVIEKPGSGHDQPALPLVEFNNSGDTSENHRKLFRTQGYGEDDGSKSPGSVKSDISDLFVRKPQPFSKLDIFFKPGRKNSAHSITSTDSDNSQIKIRNTLEWKYKVKDYQEKYQVLAEEKIRENGNNLENIDEVPWDGSFPKRSSSHQLLKALAKKTKMTKCDIILVKWIVLTDVQNSIPSKIVAGSLSLLFEKIVEFLNEMPEDYIEIFWGSAEKLVVDSAANLTTMIGCANILKELPAVSLNTSCFIKFCEGIQKYLHKSRPKVSNSEVKLLVTLDSIARTLSEEFSKGAHQWFESLVSSIHDCTIATSTELAYLLTGVLCRSKQDLRNFLTCFNIDIFGIIYSVWTTKFGSIVTPVIVDACADEITRGDLSKATVLDYSSSEQLYYLLDASKNLFLLAEKPKNFHEFFRPCLRKWLDVNFVKALSHLEKAVAVDKLELHHPTSCSSASVIDAMDIFHTMNRMWNELDWPDLDERFALATLVIQNLDRCIMYYAELIYDRVKELDKLTFEDFEISDKLCIALNNVERVRSHAELIVENLKIPDILEKFAQRGTNGTALEQCKSTPPALMDNMTDKVNRKMKVYIISACHDIEPMISTLLEKAASSQLPHFDPLKNSSLSHLNRVLYKMKSNLSQDGFKKAYPILWDNAFDTFSNVVESCIKAKKEQPIFEYLKSMFICLERLFFPLAHNNPYLSQDGISELSAKLTLYSSTSSKLILDYYLGRLDEQTEFGLSEVKRQNSVTVVPDRNETTGVLRLQILNGVFNPCWDCYLRFQIVTPALSETTEKYSTGVPKRSGEYLIFESNSMFEIKLSEEEWSSDGVIHFWLKGRGASLVRWNQFLGEAFLALSDIPLSKQEKPIRYSAQVKMPLTRPNNSSSEYLQVLNDRTGDGFAVKFIKCELDRMNLLSIETTATTP